jgi:group I intron endonuclease
MIGIYKITSPKGRVYIGQSIHIERRFNNYKKLCSCKEQPKLYNSLIKYGPHLHIFEITEECDIEKLNERERYWQDFHNVLSENGLNCRLTETTDKSGKMSEETKMNLSQKHKGKKMSEESKIKMSKSQKKII